MSFLPLRVKADLSLGLVALIWGATFVLVKDALSDVSPLLFVLLRMTLATILLALFLGRRKGQQGIWQKGLAGPGAVIGFFLFAGFVLQTQGLLYTTPAKSAFITSLYVVFVPILQVAVFRMRFRWIVLAGAAVALAGLYFLTMSAGEWKLGRGDILTLGCALAFAGHIVAVGRYAPRYSASALAVWQIGACMVFCLVMVPAAHWTGLERMTIAWTPRVWLAIVITGALGTAMAFFIQTWAQRFTTSAHTAILFSLEPVFAALTSFLLLGEVLSGRGFLGAGLILGGVLLSALSGASGPGSPGSPATR